jgi:hypothetical protein
MLTLAEIELLNRFCRFLEKFGYLDSDWYAEDAPAIGRFIEHELEIEEKKKRPLKA